MFYYSKTTNTFYLADGKENYLASGSWPDDAKEIDDNVAFEFMGEPPAGMYRKADKKGMPAWVEIPSPTKDELILLAEQERTILIAAANNHINGKQWPGKAAIGRLKDDEKQQYNLWLDYLDALDRVEISTAPDIEWPEKP